MPFYEDAQIAADEALSEQQKAYGANVVYIRFLLYHAWTRRSFLHSRGAPTQVACRSYAGAGVVRRWSSALVEIVDCAAIAGIAAVFELSPVWTVFGAGQSCVSLMPMSSIPSVGLIVSGGIAR